MAQDNFSARLNNSIMSSLLAYGWEGIGSNDDLSSDCACICLVKDEAPYLHEYIHHHLFFGFKKIIVLVNRTTDLTSEILGQIASVYPQVIFCSIDWISAIGLGGGMQKFGFAFGIAMLRSFGDIKYALLNDADELWFPSDFKSSISDWIHSVNGFGQASLCWARQLSHETSFEVPFVNRKYSYAPQVKSIVDMSMEIKMVHPHICALADGNGKKHINGLGKKFVANEKQKYLLSGNTYGHSAYILHRMQRSENEYLASLMGGNLYSDLSIKTNRNGYLNEFQGTFEVPDNFNSHYRSSLDSFIRACSLETYLAKARNQRITKAESFVDTVARISKEYPNQINELQSTLNKVLRGTRLSGMKVIRAR